MTNTYGPRRRGKARAGIARLAVAALVMTAATSAMITTATPASAAVATVGNGITTTDLASVGTTPNTLASTLVGSGVTVSNVTFSGDDAQAGLIHVVDPAVVSFNDGIIMSSGNIADIVGPNKSDGITGDMAGPADPDLDALIADTQTVNPVTFDAAALEFDFVPTASTVYFTYKFTSDEYLEWVNLFNDVFAFYVNGQNCATVPSGAPISINTINSDVNPALFRDNSFSSLPPNPINIESDGLSVEMICTATVQPGQTNHMKLAIADTSDQILDSTVILKSQSLSTVKPESCNDHVDNDDDSLVDDLDDSCSSSTTPPPVGSEGVGSSGKTPPFTGNEGTPIPLDGEALNWKASNDTIYTQWTVTGINGTTGTCEISPAGFQPILPDRVIAQATAICPNEGEYVAMVEGWDVEGGSAFDKDVDFFVHNAPPVVAIDSPTLGSEAPVGETVDLSATVLDPGVADANSCEISWGDGDSEAGVLQDGVCTGSHVYGAEGDLLVSVTATDDAGDSAAAATFLSIAPDSFHLAGAVVSDSSGLGLGGMQVQALTSNNSVVRTVTTDLDGSFDLLDLAPGTEYRVRAQDLGSPTNFLSVTSPLVTAPTVGLELAMVPVAHLAGTVTSSATGLPVSGIRVQALKADNSVARTAFTGVDGTYDVTSLASGASYRLRYVDVSSIPVYVSALSPTTIVAGTSGINQELAPRGHITGTVTASATGSPLAGIRVQAMKTDNSIVGTTYTDVDGTYDLGSLTSGSSYRIRFADLSAPPTFSASTTTSLIPAGTAGVDQALVMYLPASGTVAQAVGGAPMAGVRVQLVKSDNSIVQTVVTGSDGTFNLTKALMGTTYKVRYSDTQVPARFGVATSLGVPAGTTGIVKAL